MSKSEMAVDVPSLLHRGPKAARISSRPGPDQVKLLDFHASDMQDVATLSYIGSCCIVLVLFNRTGSGAQLE